MFRTALLIAMIPMVSACHTFLNPEKVVEYKYIEKPKLNIEVPQKPDIINETEFTLYSDGKVCISPNELKSHIVDLITIQEYISKLEAYIDVYKLYYETESQPEINSPNQ